MEEDKKDDEDKVFERLKYSPEQLALKNFREFVDALTTEIFNRNSKEEDD